MLRLQGGVCAVCRGVPKCGFLNVDHRHAKGFKRMTPEEKRRHVRGLICPYCNHHLVGRHMTTLRARQVLDYLTAHAERTA